MKRDAPIKNHHSRSPRTHSPSCASCTSSCAGPSRSHARRRAFAASSVHDTFNFITVAILFPLEYFFRILEHAATWMGRIFVDVTGITKPENYLKKITKPAVEGLADLVATLVAEPAGAGSVVRFRSRVRFDGFFDTFLSMSRYKRNVEWRIVKVIKNLKAYVEAK